MNITSERVLILLNAGYQVYTVWFFNNFTDTGSTGHREYQTMIEKNGRIELAT